MLCSLLTVTLFVELARYLPNQNIYIYIYIYIYRERERERERLIYMRRIWID